MNKINIFFTLIISLSSFIKSQDMVQEFLNGPIKDTEQLIEGYMSPFGKWFGSGLNAGWYNTAKSHQFPGFDVTGGIHLIQPPESAMLFAPTLHDLIVNSTNQELSTFIGPSNNKTSVFKELCSSTNGSISPTVSVSIKRFSKSASSSSSFL